MSCKTIDGNGFIFYKGPSQLDNSPIVGIATLNSKNSKTGDMVQTWILSAKINPMEAVKKGKDISICGDCKFRGGICYVAIHQAPLNIWRKYHDGGYPYRKTPYLFANKLVRCGAYGDPTAIPYNVWEAILAVVKNHTAYTHQWRKKEFQKYKEFCMASVDNEAEAILARSMGWRTFRVKKEEDGRLENEIICPASRDDLKVKITCDKCLLCNGLTRSSSNIVENVHGVSFKINNFKKLGTVQLPLVS